MILIDEYDGPILHAWTVGTFDPVADWFRTFLTAGLKDNPALHRAVLTGVLVGLGISASLPALILIFAVASLVAWYILRRTMGVRQGQVKIWDRDINDNP